MTNGEKLKAILNPRANQIKIFGNWVEIEIQKLDINFSCGLEWWNTEYIEPNCSEIPNRSTTKNDLVVDAVSRKSVITIIQNHWWNCRDIDKLVNELPAITPIRPKGHWISHIEHCKQNNLLPSGLGSYFWCSECDCGVDSKVFHRVNYNYCPNCGCKME